MEDSAISGNAGEIDAVVIGLADFPRRKTAAIVTRRALARIDAHQPEEGFLISARHTVDRHHEDRTAGGLGSLDQRLRNLPARRGVKLEPDWCPARIGDVFHGIVRSRRQDLQMIAGAHGLGDSNLAVGVKGFVAAGRAYENRRIKLGAEKLHAGIDLGHVPETAREELEFQEPLARFAARNVTLHQRRCRRPCSRNALAARFCVPPARSRTR